MRMLRLAALALLLPATAAAQDDDRGFLTRMLEDNLSSPGREVRVIGFEGALSSQARVAEITIADADGIWLSLRDVELDWTRSALLSGRIEVNRLVAGEITLDRPPLPGEPDLPDPEAAPFSLPELPVSVRIGEVSAGRVNLGAPILGQPVAVTLQGSARLEGGEGEAAITIERIDGTAGRLALSGAFDNESRRLRLDLSAQEPAGGIAAGLLGLPGAPALDLSIRGDDPLDDFTASLRLASDGQERLTGTVALRSVAEAAGPPGRAFRADLSGDLAPLFLPEYHDFFGPEIALLAEGRQAGSGALDLSVLRLTAQRLRLDGAARIAADGLPQAFDLALDLEGAGGEPVLLPLPGTPVRVSSARLRLGLDGARSDAWRLAGTLDGLQTDVLDLRRVQLDGSGRIGRQPGGEQSVGGTVRFGAEGIAPVDPDLATALGDALEGGFKFAWAAGGPLRLSQIGLAGGGVEIGGRLRVDGPDPVLRLSGRIEAGADDFARFAALAGQPLGGAGRFEIEGEGLPLDGAFDMSLAVTGRDLRVGMAEVDSLLRGDSAVTLSAERSVAGTEIRSLSVRAGTLAADLSGWLRTGGSELAGTLDFSDLSALGGPYRGALSVRADLAQIAGTDRLTLSGTGRDLAIGIPEADGFLQGVLALDIAAARDGAGTITLDRVRLNGPRVVLSADGSVGEALRDVSATLRLPDLAAAGPRYRGSLAGDLRYRMADGRETVSLEARGANLAVGQAEADRLLGGSVVLSARVAREGGLLSIESADLRTGQLTAQATARDNGAGRRVDLTARLADLGLFVPGVPGPVTLEGRLTEAGRDLSIDATATGPGGLTARTSGTLARDLSRAALSLSGQADTGLANAFVAPLSLRGPVRFDLRLDGPPALSAVSGRIVVSDTRLSVANPPFAFRDLAATIDLAGGAATLDVRAFSEAGGSLTAQGRLGLTAPFDAALAVGLDALALRDPDLYQTSATGTLRIDGPLTGGARIAGRIGLDGAEIRIPSGGLGPASGLTDLRHRNEPVAVRRTRDWAGLLDEASGSGGNAARPYALDLTISAPNRIFIRGRGLDAELGGELTLSGTTAQVIPIGGFNLIRGRLDLLGKRFVLSEGRLLLEGDLNPRVELSAVTTSDDFTATISVAGPAREPAIRFLSQPELPEEEVVARLLFGRGLENLSAFQAVQLASAVATLTGRGGDGVVGRLRQSFGLDDFDVTTGADGAAAVRAGKYISENVYADVVVESTGRSEVQLNLDLSPSITVRGRATSTGTTGIGVYFERDY
jgi:translocation and assembly module TamB